jgi:insertion element IS1 protein InsB
MCVAHAYDSCSNPYQDHATFHTDQYAVYSSVIPAEHHKAITRKTRRTNHIERFNTTLRHRLSCLVRATLSFKKVENPIGAITFFMCHYTLEQAVA